MGAIVPSKHCYSTSLRPGLGATAGQIRKQGLRSGDRFARSLLASLGRSSALHRTAFGDDFAEGEEATDNSGVICGASEFHGLAECGGRVEFTSSSAQGTEIKFIFLLPKAV